VLVGGADLTTMSRNDRARAAAPLDRYVFQDFNLLAGLTAVENAAMPLELDGVGVKAARATSLAALEELASPTCGPAIPMSSRVASVSGWRSREPWWGTAICFWPTSRREHWTRSTAMR
jgi:hypothetical protein